jgi:hypothetical protein
MKRTPRLLIVGEHPLCDVWRILFATRGWEVAVARGESEALARLDPAPDYVILAEVGDAIPRRVRELGLRSRVAFASDLATARPDAAEDTPPGAPASLVRTWRDGMLSAAS